MTASTDIKPSMHAAGAPRGAAYTAETVAFGPFRVDATRRLLYRDGEPVHLTPRAFDLLVAFVRRPGEVLSRQELLQQVWGESFVEEANLTQTVFLLRRALDERAGDHRYLATVPGRGYAFVAPVEAVTPPPALAPSVTRQPAPASANRPWKRAAAVAAALAATCGVVALSSGPHGPPGSSSPTAGAGLGARVEGAQPPSFAAYEAYLKGRYFLDQRAPGSFSRARQEFEAALAADPSYAPALAGLADVHLLAGFYRVAGVPPADSFARAEQAARRAVALAPQRAETRATLGMALLLGGSDATGGLGELRRALALDPRNPRIHHWYGWVLVSQGRLEEGRAAMERAHALDPLSLITRSARGVLAYYAGDHAAASRHLEEVLDIDPQFGRALHNLGLVRAEQRDLRAAAALVEASVDTLGGSSEPVASLAHIYGQSGRRDDWRRTVAQLEAGAAPPFELAIAYLGVGDVGRAGRHLSAAIAEGGIWPWSLRYDPRLAPLQSTAMRTSLPAPDLLAYPPPHLLHQ